MENRLSQLLAFLKSNPDDSFILFALAKEYENVGDDENALAHYNQILSLDPDYTGLYYHLGKLYQKLGNFNLALKTFNAGMEICNKLNDQHAFNELVSAKMDLVDDE